LDAQVAAHYALPIFSGCRTASVIRVGDGRGFVVENAERASADRLVITAAHCLPSFPPCASFSTLEDRTYQALLGPLGQEPTVWAECLFVDPVGDIAVLGPPDGQALYEQWEAYVRLTEGSGSLPIGGAPKDGQA
jgi:hypothetical protein